MSNEGAPVQDLHPAATPTETGVLERWLTQKRPSLARASVMSALLHAGLGIVMLVVQSFVIFMCLIWTRVTGGLVPNPVYVLVVLAMIFVAYPFVGRNRSSAKQERVWWIILGIFFIPPHCFDQAIQELRDARRVRALDVESCAAVLTRVWDRGRAVYNHQLLEWIPHIDLEQTLTELRLIPGVTLLTETPGVTCSGPLLEEIGRFVASEGASA